MFPTRTWVCCPPCVEWVQHLFTSVTTQRHLLVTLIPRVNQTEGGLTSRGNAKAQVNKWKAEWYRFLCIKVSATVVVWNTVLAKNMKNKADHVMHQIYIHTSKTNEMCFSLKKNNRTIIFQFVKPYQIFQTATSAQETMIIPPCVTSCVTRGTNWPP